MSKTTTKLTVVGGGSVGWCPKLFSDVSLNERLDNIDFYLLDIDLSAAERIGRLGRKIAKERKKNFRFFATSDQKSALSEADFIIITISTGGLKAMEYDIKIPEEYGVFHTVGDTVGPGGWARGLRNIPVFMHLAGQIKDYAPTAVVMNYSNPMGTLTQTLCEILPDQPVVGLCHAVFESLEVLKLVFGLESEDQITAQIAGPNHFIWFLDFKIDGRDGLSALREVLRDKNLGEVITSDVYDEAGFMSGKYVADKLFKQYGYLPYVADRHITEFVPGYLTENEDNIKRYKLNRTDIKYRKDDYSSRLKNVDDIIAGKEPLPPRSREIVADILVAFLYGKNLVEVCNLPNKGQVKNLPEGPVLESYANISPRGFEPVLIGNVPPVLKKLMEPHLVNQNLIVESVFEKNLEKAYFALINDPLCGHLKKDEIIAMANKLLSANKKFLGKHFQFQTAR
jgi:galacturan 1,4-alpha-galacturonidase